MNKSKWFIEGYRQSVTTENEHQRVGDNLSTT